MLNKILVFILIAGALLNANFWNAHELRKANHLVKKAEYTESMQIYNRLPNAPKITFNKAFTANLMGEKENSNDYYNQLLKDKKMSKSEKAKYLLNMGNDALQRGEIKEAKKYYRLGLLQDNKNKKLKNNLELANNLKIVEQKQKNKNEQNKGNNQKDKSQNKNQSKTAQQKNAEKMLDSLKDQEQEDLINRMQQQEKKVNVEKDW